MQSMTIREQAEEREYQFFSPYAAHAGDSEGRDRAEEPLSVQRQLERYRETARIRSRNERTRIPRYREELR